MTTTTAPTPAPGAAMGELGAELDRALVAIVVATVARHTADAVSADDLDRDLLDLHVEGRQLFEIAGELAERVDLPGHDDDAVNAVVVEALARSRTMRRLAERLVLYRPSRRAPSIAAVVTAA